MRNHIASLLVVVVALVAGGCATIIKGTHERVTIQTSPPGAKVFVNESYAGVSPVSMSLEQKDHRIRAELAGHEPGAGQITTGFSGWTLLGGPLSIIIDCVTGAVTTIDNPELMLNLQPTAPPPAPAPPPSPTAPQS